MKTLRIIIPLEEKNWIKATKIHARDHIRKEGKKNIVGWAGTAAAYGALMGTITGSKAAGIASAAIAGGGFAADHVSHIKKIRKRLNQMKEAPELDVDYTKDNRLKTYKDLPYDTANSPLSKTSTGHHIYSLQTSGATKIYYAHNPKTNHPDMSVSGEQHGKHFHIHVLSGREGSTIKAHEFYGHLIKKHGLILNSSTAHSPGSQKTWKKVADDKDINTTHRDKKDQKIPLNKGVDWEHNYDKPYHDSYFQAKKKAWYKRIMEAPEMLKGYDQEDNRLKDDKAHYNTSKSPLSTTSSGHQIYKVNGESNHYFAHNPHTGLPDIWVSGKEKGKEFHEIALAGRKGSTIKAHEFYAHLIKQHGMVFHSSDQHSRGGANVWKKLANDPDIHMERIGRKFGFEKKLPIHKGDDWDKNYADQHGSYFKATRK